MRLFYTTVLVPAFPLRQILGKISPWIVEHIDSEDELVRRNAELALEQETKFAAHLSVPAVICPVPLACYNSRR